MKDAGRRRSGVGSGDLSSKVEHESMLRRFCEDERRANTHGLLYGAVPKPGEQPDKE